MQASDELVFEYNGQHPASFDQMFNYIVWMSASGGLMFGFCDQMSDSKGWRSSSGTPMSHHELHLNQNELHLNQNELHLKDY